ncbi:MAG TPA: hypothetical protein VD862_04870 [Candidatus Paceibacterota bacterium]|nr:hypothetical protein [Candidatus Paceibacterota bacterium]
MPLPENWNGVFYGPGLMDDCLIDWEPARYVAMLDDHCEGDLAGFIFLIGGAYLDLSLHNMRERAEEILKEAERRHTNVPWNFFRTRTPGLLQSIRTLGPGNRALLATALRARMNVAASTIAQGVTRLNATSGSEREAIAAQLTKLNEAKPAVRGN